MMRELQSAAFMALRHRFGAVKAYFLWLSLDSYDLQRMTKKPGPPLVMDVVSIGTSQHGWLVVSLSAPSTLLSFR